MFDRKGLWWYLQSPVLRPTSGTAHLLILNPSRMKDVFTVHQTNKEQKKMVRTGWTGFSRKTHPLFIEYLLEPYYWLNFKYQSLSINAMNYYIHVQWHTYRVVNMRLNASPLFSIDAHQKKLPILQTHVHVCLRLKSQFNIAFSLSLEKKTIASRLPTGHCPLFPFLEYIKCNSFKRLIEMTYLFHKLWALTMPSLIQQQLFILLFWIMQWIR